MDGVVGVRKEDSMPIRVLHPKHPHPRPIFDLARVTTPRTDTAQWYTVFGEYDQAAGTFDFVVMEQGTDVVFYEEYDIMMSPDTFNRIAFGASTKNWDGSAAEMHIDNIFVYEL